MANCHSKYLSRIKKQKKINKNTKFQAFREKVKKKTFIFYCLALIRTTWLVIWITAKPIKNYMTGRGALGEGFSKGVWHKFILHTEKTI